MCLDDGPNFQTGLQGNTDNFKKRVLDTFLAKQFIFLNFTRFYQRMASQITSELTS